MADLSASKVETQRLFLAVKPTATMVKKLCQQIEQLSPGFDASAVNWSQAESLHLTLRFIGDVEPHQLEQLRQQMAVALQGKQPFSVSLTDVACFSSGHGRFLVIEVAPNQWLDQLVNDLSGGVVSLGYPGEKRPYRGHITLGRLRRSAPAGITLNSVWDVCALEVNQVVLLQSRLTAKGAEYVQLDRWELAGEVCDEIEL